MKPKRVQKQPSDVASRLYELGLTEEVLRTAIQVAMQHVMACTKYDPPSLRGMLGWGKGIRSLREDLCPKGWLPRNVRNYETVEHPDGRCAVTVAAGDALTGLDEQHDPSTRSAKGPATEEAISENQEQSEIADFIEEFPRVKQAPHTQTWLLLFYADKTAEEIRIELSLPSGMSDDGHVNTWSERIILGAAPYATAPKVEIENGDDDDAAIEVPVERIG